ncbi:MAG TPA: hypothetical protein VNU93_02330, partial [Verrucomicrobiae bacterium]|nr:hypothetical protein [Verrucomicrobiae bacterium]
MNEQNMPILRMMDANLNRVAEGLRVVEDVLRFGFEDQIACKAVRALRHRVRDALGGVYADLLAGRNVQADPGVSISKEQVLDSKKSVPELLIANLKRAQEGLRVLEESAHLLGNRSLAKEVEGIRFAAYELEQDLSQYVTTKQPDTGERGAGWRLPEGIYA